MDDEEETDLEPFTKDVEAYTIMVIEQSLKELKENQNTYEDGTGI